MFDYVMRLLVLVPFVGGLAWVSLMLWKRVQTRLPARPAGNKVAITASLSLGTQGKLAVVEFQGRELLVAVSRSGITLLADAHENANHA